MKLMQTERAGTVSLFGFVRLIQNCRSKNSAKLAYYSFSVGTCYVNVTMIQFVRENRSAVALRNQQQNGIDGDAMSKKDGSSQYIPNAMLQQPQPTTFECGTVVPNSQAGLWSCLRSPCCGMCQRPSYLNDPSLQVLLSELEKNNASIRNHEAFQAHVAEVEEQLKQEFSVRIASSSASAGDQKEDKTKRTFDQEERNTNTLADWMICFDDEVGAEYYYNERTGEASWVDPRQTVSK